MSAVRAAWRHVQSPPDVVGAAEAAALLGVSRQRFGELSKRPGFPPHTKLKCGPVWWPAHILEWGRLPRGRGR